MKLQLVNNKYFEIIESTNVELKQLKLILTKRIPKWRFHPLVRSKKWDGYITKLHKNVFVPVGLWHYVKTLMKKYNIEVEFMDLNTIFHPSPPTFEEFSIWANELMHGHAEIKEIYDYQLETAYKFIRYRFANGELSTSAGKTLITFLTVRWLLEKDNFKKILIIVPRVDLVSQGYDDFEKYNIKKYPLKIEEIYSGAKKIRGESNVVISTYQSLVNRKKSFFDDFDCVIIDELHKAKIVPIDKVMNLITNAKMRVGITGTLPSLDTIDYLTILEHTGPTVSEISSAKLIASGRATPVDVKILRMDYVKEDIKKGLATMFRGGPDNRKRVYALEKKIVVESKKRLVFICKLIERSTKNCAVMFFRKVHGRETFNYLKKITTDKEIYYIDGETPNDLRKEYISRMKFGQNKILVVSSAIFSTGISINNLHTIYLMDPYKNEIIMRQILGRLMRLYQEKEKGILIDFVDNFSITYTDEFNNTHTFKNYLLTHSDKRIKMYKEREFNYEIKDVKF